MLFSKSDASRNYSKILTLSLSLVSNDNLFSVFSASFFSSIYSDFLKIRTQVMDYPWSSVAKFSFYLFLLDSSEHAKCCNYFLFLGEERI